MGIAPGTIVRLYHGEMESKGLVLSDGPTGVYVQVDEPRPRTIVMPHSMVEAP